jgi:flagellin
MSRINSNVPSLVAQRVFTMQNSRLSTSLTRLSTGLRINNGKDDPAGLIASENLRAEKNALQAGLSNISRADNIIAVAEGSLDEINNLLTELETLVDQSANEAAISVEERNANQLQIDSILESINRIANTTEFQGKKLLDGNLDYATSSINSNDLAGVQVLGAKINNGSTRQVIVEVTNSAEKGQLVYGASTTGGTNVTLQIAGNLGSDTFSFASGTNITAVRDAINGSSDLTGVTARVSAGNLIFESKEYGSSQFVSVKTISGSFSLVGGATRDEGEDASVLINGSAAVTQGLKASVRTASLSADIDLTATRGTTLGTTTFYIKDGGANFAISPDLSLAGLVSLGLPAVTTGNLGESSIGFVSTLATGQANALSSGNYNKAQQIIRSAQDTVSKLRGRLGAFQKNTLETTKNSLTVTYENLTAAESTIRDTDFAAETSNLTRAQILVQSSTNTLRLANQSPQSLLALLQ